METRYIYQKGNNNLKVSYSFEAREALQNFSYTFELACFLMQDIFNVHSIFVDLVNLENSSPWGLELSIKTNNGPLTLILNDRITIKSNKLEVTYKHQLCPTNIIAHIVSLTAFFGDLTISYEYNNRYLKVHITYPDEAYSLEVPNSLEHMINYNFFRAIKKGSTILDLKKFYERTLLPLQDEYDQKLATTLSTSKKVNNELLLMDKLSIKEGRIEDYLLSSIKDGVIISLEKNGDNPEVKVRNFTLNSSVNLNEEAASLLIRKRTLTNPKIYSLN